MKTHKYQLAVSWTGNLGTGTSTYRAYNRNHEITAPGKSAPIQGSADPVFRGDPTRYNPEELLVTALSACHMLSYLHLCAAAGIVVTAYSDEATGAMAEKDGSAQFTEVTLHPKVTITDAARIDEATNLHHRAHELCFIARSVNFPVHAEPAVTHAP